MLVCVYKIAHSFIVALSVPFRRQLKGFLYQWNTNYL